MRLYDFIDEYRERILAEWEAFARSASHASGTMDVAALRDHADEMLTVIAADLRTVQTPHQQADKGKGRAVSGEAAATAAEHHGAGRAESGFSVEEMVAEYRALRASVLKLWALELGQLEAENIEDLIRFNEAIDQSLAESVAEFNANVEEAKEMFLAILGHDLRTPLGAIYTSAELLRESGRLEEPYLSLAARIARSAIRTVGLVGDLLDFTRSRLGGGIPIVPTQLDLDRLLREVVDEISAAHPHRHFLVHSPQAQRGEWDDARLRQALTNIIVNAEEHAPPDTPVSIALHAAGEDVAISIHNMGSVITGERLDGLFNPMKTRSGESLAAHGGPTANLGLGLYIADRIVHAHAGSIAVESAEVEGTTFTLHLPRGQTT